MHIVFELDGNHSTISLQNVEQRQEDLEIMNSKRSTPFNKKSEWEDIVALVPALDRTPALEATREIIIGIVATAVVVMFGMTDL